MGLRAGKFGIGTEERASSRPRTTRATDALAYISPSHPAVVKIDHLFGPTNPHHGVMKVTEKQALAVRCPTCGAKVGENANSVPGNRALTLIATVVWQRRRSKHESRPRYLELQ